MTDDNRVAALSEAVRRTANTILREMFREMLVVRIKFAAVMKVIDDRFPGIGDEIRSTEEEMMNDNENLEKFAKIADQDFTLPDDIELLRNFDGPVQ